MSYRMYGKEIGSKEYYDYLISGSYIPDIRYHYFSSGTHDSLVPLDTNMEVIRPAWIVCDHCGIRNPDDSKTFYCVACGAPLPENQFLIKRYNDRRST